MKISVITINYNNGEQLEATIQSVVSNVTVLRELLGEKAEYIVIDGGSVDCSVSVLQKYSEYISYWISEKDKGIYHAMNKGISVAQGEYCFFLNSGDTFYEDDTLKKALLFLKEDFVCGNAVLKYAGGINEWSAKTVVFDIDDDRIKLAKEMGAYDGVNTLEEGFMEKAMAMTDGKGFDYIYETAGSTITMKMAYELAANKAGICYIGKPTKELTFTVEEWENMNRKEFTMTGSWLSYSAPFPGHEWDCVAHYFATGQLKGEEALIFKKLPLSRIAEGFEMFKTRGAVKGKILIDSEA